MEQEGPEVTFMFQFGLIRDCVTVLQSSLNLKTIKDLAVDFINSKVGTSYRYKGYVKRETSLWINNFLFLIEKKNKCEYDLFQIPDHGINMLGDRILLFRHEYNSNNILQVINSASEIADETLIEIVLTGKSNSCLYRVLFLIDIVISIYL